MPRHVSNTVDLQWPIELSSCDRVPKSPLPLVNMMKKTGFKHIFIALLLLAFTSQSLAALMMPCQFLSMKSHEASMHSMSGMSNMAGMDHSMNMTQRDSDDSKSQDCCKMLDHCPSGNCSMVFGNEFELTLPSNRINVVLSYTAFVPEFLVASLFRPPISR